MYNFAPDNYESPFVLASEGISKPGVLSVPEDFIYNDGVAMALICSHQFVGTSLEGHVLVVPAQPYENIFDIPDTVHHRVADLVKAVAHAMKAEYKCGGITTWQNNGPEALQDVWHFHTHVIPRNEGDDYFGLLGQLGQSFKELDPDVRAGYAERLRSRLKDLRLGE